ncbi:Cof-type HAD-IIB family hydrolase [Thalassorhabdus alkalitolerans]|uniref:Cof-type HAD-IIB family hydrolase n=1 Tax=Thalassorhabdus alkalitolerans TaxID=2282697 RepID=A0ABW0YIV6_9BACI
MKKPGIVFFDIDGTLYTKEMIVPPSTKEAIAELKNKGVYVAIATGRAPFMFEELREELGIETFVSFNGSYVVAEGEVIEKKPLNFNYLTRLKEHAESQNHPMVFVDHEDFRSTVSNHPHIVESVGGLKLPYPSEDPDYFKEREIYQALLFCSGHEEHVYLHSHPKFDFVRWHNLAVDVLPQGGSKAEGIKTVARHLGFTIDEAAAFGDALNDIQMLEMVGTGVAMGNALDKTKAAADFVTASVDEGGIRAGLETLGLLEGNKV